jgi:hypothetical protein
MLRASTGLAKQKELDLTMQYSNTSQPETDRLRHLIILPTYHEKVMELKDKLSAFHNHSWEIKDFGAFGAFEWGFIIIEIHDLQGYHNFKRDICNLVEKGAKYIYPEHIACWI